MSSTVITNLPLATYYVICLGNIAAYLLNSLTYYECFNLSNYSIIIIIDK